MPRSTFVRIVLLVAAIAALVVGFNMFMGTKGNLSVPKVPGDGTGGM